MATKLGICGLCGKHTILQESHIIPKFVFRWMKETGGKYIRKADNPNKRVEDGIKENLLCKECEKLFCKFEDEFARKIFYPYVNEDIDNFFYSDNLMKFSISVLYRIILNSIKENNLSDIPHSKQLFEAFEEWKAFLHEQKSILKYNKVHIFFTSLKLKQDIIPTERFLNYYARGIDGCIPFGAKTCYVYAKLARIILIGEINNFDNSEMKNTLINLNGGFLKTSEMKISFQVKDFIVDRVKQINKLYDNISNKQRKIATNSTEYLTNEKLLDLKRIVENQNKSIIDETMIDFE